MGGEFGGRWLFAPTFLRGVVFHEIHLAEAGRCPGDLSPSQSDLHPGEEQPGIRMLDRHHRLHMVNHALTKRTIRERKGAHGRLLWIKGRAGHVGIDGNDAVAGREVIHGSYL